MACLRILLRLLVTITTLSAVGPDLSVDCCSVTAQLLRNRPNLVVVRIVEQETGSAKPSDRVGRWSDAGPNRKSAVEEDTWKTRARSHLSRMCRIYQPEWPERGL